MNRRDVIRAGAGLAALSVGGRWLLGCSNVDAASSPAGGIYGPLGPPDANGLRLPPGFSSRVVATSGERVAATGYVWHPNPDGGATFPADDGGWIYVSNSETDDEEGGVSMVRFDREGTIVEARSIISGTSRNCAGGATPWGTWLTCEEVPDGQVHECDPTGAKRAEARPAMGRFNHEAVAVETGTKALYLTEDEEDGALYRFRPSSYPDLSSGALEVMTERDGVLGWERVPDPSGTDERTAKQVGNTKEFNGGEGICSHAGAVFFTTKGDNRIWRYDPKANRLSVVYDAERLHDPVLSGVDNITAARNGDLYVAEDGDNMQVVHFDGHEPGAVVQVVGAGGSEITGPAFTPDGTRLYFSSQRNPGRTYEVLGPWRR